jgi:hypothetical protein
MAKPEEGYQWVEVESYKADRTGGLHGEIHVRPVAGGQFPSDLRVECSKKMARDHPVGTRFRIKAKLTDLEGGGKFLYSYHGWKFDVIDG